MSSPLSFGIAGHRVGSAHWIGFVLLLFFACQCAWFTAHVPITQVEANYAMRGVAQMHGVPISADSERSPLISMLAVTGVAPLVYHKTNIDLFWLDRHRWLLRLPFLFAGFLLGASVFYVARKLYGPRGGYIAVGIYCFSPGLIERSCLVGPEIVGAWGAFGLIFTAIATAHTLYAPREVVFWNWKRILILGLSIFLAVGSQWSLIWLIIPAVAFMLWAVPHRRMAALTIVGAAFALALLLMIATYGASLRAFAHGVASSMWPGVTIHSARQFVTFGKILLEFYANASPAIVVCGVIALVTYFAWKRTRFFGNTAPLLISVMLLAFGFLLSQAGGALHFFFALPFLLVFTSGVFADLVESKRPSVPYGVAYGMILAQVVYSIAGLMRIFGRGM